MPVYEFRCSECGAVLEERRLASAANAPGPGCPHGHGTTRKVFSLFATVNGPGSPSPAPPGGCGAGCACQAGSSA